ncbi:MAG TPA: lysylphosphatidylglycerol synthase transmembrane domain-containing protein [Anaerolineales bacterium]|nr:lysylphosphatidylglycerol synthase transmembrane domain-containing protein [Anaerolineales bacterium]
MRKFIFFLAIFLSAAFLYISFGELESMLETIQRGNLWFMLLALFLQFGWFAVLGSTYLALYRVLGLNGTVYKFSLMAAAASFVNIIAPSGGMSGTAVFISEAYRNNQSRGKVTIATMLNLFIDYMAFLIVLTLGLLVLWRRNDLDPTEIVASAVIFGIAACLGFLLYLGSRSATALGNALSRMARIINRLTRPFIHRDYLSEERAHEFANEMAEDLQSLPQKSNSLIKPLLYAFANKALMMGILVACFLAFNVPFTTGTIIGGFAITYLFLIVSPTPNGIGIVEGVMPLALSSLRVPWSQAVIITLAYRGITFWVPLGVGAAAFRMLNKED